LSNLGLTNKLEKGSLLRSSLKNVGKDYEKNLKMETAILQKVHHPNIIELKELVDTKDYLYLIMELVTGGELFDKIVEKGSYTEAEAAHLVYKIISAVLYCMNQELYIGI